MLREGHRCVKRNVTKPVAVFGNDSDLLRRALNQVMMLIADRPEAQHSEMRKGA